MNNWFFEISPFIIMSLSLIVFIGVLFLFKLKKRMSLLSLSVIPLSFLLLSLLIILSTPDDFTFKLMIRSVAVFSLSVAVHVIFIDIKNFYEKGAK